MKTTFFRIFIPLIFSLIFGSCARQQNSLNLDFEKIDQKTHYPEGWTVDAGSTHRIICDSVTRQNGKYSLLIENRESNVGSVTQLYKLITNIQPKHGVSLSGYIRKENITSDTTGVVLGYYTFSTDTIIKLHDIKPGNNDWQEFSIKFPATESPDYSFIGILFTGTGRMWIDNLKLYVDGTEILENPRQPEIKPGKTELEWLKDHYSVIKTVNPGESFEDLLPLKEMIGDARIVALGENTHGSSEVFKMKHRLVEFLVKEMGFDIFSIEANMPEAYKVNDYFFENKGDPKSLLKGMYFWTWNTQEVLDMIEWMRSYNLSEAGKIRFTGFDMQYYMGSMGVIGKFAESYDPILKAKVDSLDVAIEDLKKFGSDILNRKAEIGSVKTKCIGMRNYISQNRNRIVANSDTANYNWLLQNATVLVQSLGVAEGGTKFRDESMAANVKWILENNPESKIILWAHNGHISKRIGMMGYHLARQFGSNYYNIGFVSNSGKYTAINSGKLNSENVLEPGIPGSFEYNFHLLGTPAFYFDFSKVNDKEPDGLWLRSKLLNRNVGALAIPNQFNPTLLNKNYNAIIYLDQTNPTVCFDVK